MAAEKKGGKGKKEGKPPESSESTEEYLEAMYRLHEEGKKLSTTQIAEKLGVSPASASEMLRRLGKGGFVRHAPYRDIALTGKGRRLGRKILGRHRLLERFLDHMGMRRHRIHGEACKLEHYVSDELSGLIEKGLDAPRTRKGILSLREMRKGEEGDIISIEGCGRAARRLEDMGLTPGTRVKVIRSAPFSGPVEIRIRDYCLVIGRGMANRIFVGVSE